MTTNRFSEIPIWLKQHIRANRRTATLTQCRRCKTPILTGLDNHIAALTAKVDPTPITPLGETIALLTGRTTYTLTTTLGRKELHHRDHWQIQAPRKYPVLPEHRCGQSFDAYAETVHPPRRYVSPNEPPY